MRIILNRIQCRKCKDIITSESRNDFKTCCCKSISIDGGNAYIRRGGNKSDWIELSEFEEEIHD